MRFVEPEELGLDVWYRSGTKGWACFEAEEVTANNFSSWLEFLVFVRMGFKEECFHLSRCKLSGLSPLLEALGLGIYSLGLSIF